MSSGLRNGADPQEIERIFGIYKDAPIYPHTGKPSLSHTAAKAHVTRRTVGRLRDKYGWEERRLAIVKDAQREADKRRAAEDAKSIEIVGELYKAALNHLSRQVRNGELALTASEAIQLGRYYAFVKGDPDTRSEDVGRSRVVVVLPDNGRRLEDVEDDKVRRIA